MLDIAGTVLEKVPQKVVTSVEHCFVRVIRTTVRRVDNHNQWSRPRLVLLDNSLYEISLRMIALYLNNCALLYYETLEGQQRILIRPNPLRIDLWNVSYDVPVKTQEDCYA